ncbi:cell division protein FtsI [Aquabacterium sp.]|uniref:cell division protein FtsI n=1 Tax=Aquabacterium sp. TaxID=1872578 RepID=UPI0035B22650
MRATARIAARALMASSLTLSGCSVLSPLPLWELAKASGSAVSTAVAHGPASATHTVIHDHPPIQSLCIEYNANSPVADIVPAIQAELKIHQIESRVYEASIVQYRCGVWLRYVAYQEWGTQPFTGEYATYVSSATVSLFTDGGNLIASSSYEKPGAFGTGKWSSTRSKLAPVIAAVTGNGAAAISQPDRNKTP